MRHFSKAVVFCLGLLAFAAIGQTAQADYTRFFGNYSGSAQVQSGDGTTINRDMAVSIREADEGFEVQWTSVTYRPDGRVKEKQYTIAFVPTDRDGVYAAAQQTNMFGHAVQLDPMKGEPYVWAQLKEDTLSVYSLFVNDDGGYNLQHYDRTLVEGGLQLDYQSLQNGQPDRTVRVLLQRVE